MGRAFSALSGIHSRPSSLIRTPPFPESHSRRVCGTVRRLKRTVIQRLRVLGTIEGISFLVLMGIAMPLKYGFDYTHATFWPGLAHGILFLLYCAALAHAKRVLARPIGWAVKLFTAALLPFGPFVMDKNLKRELDEGANGD
jgi:integral membrane protein